MENGTICSLNVCKSLKKTQPKPCDTRGHKYYPVVPQQYILIDEIGRGGSAVVYRAHCIPFDEVVAIKCVDLDRSNTDLNKVQHEAQTLMLLSHPNVLSAHCAFVVDTQLWEVMPYMAGGSFQNILKSSFPYGFEKSVIATVLRETLKALDYLHKGGHIHRDVKAGNILVDRDGSVKLADYGVSAFIFESGDWNKMRRNTVSGTLFWMAPEVLCAEGSKEGYDCKADIWSFGITAMELAQGRPPLSPAAPIDSGAVPRLTDAMFSKSFKEMVGMCLVLDPYERPSAEKLLKHSFFKNHAKTPRYLVKHVLHALHPLSQRLKVCEDEKYRCYEAGIALAGFSPSADGEEGSCDNWDFAGAKETTGQSDNNCAKLLGKRFDGNSKGVEPDYLLL